MNFDLKKITLLETATIDDAVRALDEGALRIVLVVDNVGKLVGSVTDGDIRRGLIAHSKMSESLTRIMNKSPVTASMTQNRESVLRLMREREILQVPIVDGNGRVVSVEFLQELTKKKSLANPVLIMAGGFGKRLRPLTADLPKPMLKVGRKPILESIVEQLIDSGFRHVYISIHYKGDMVRDYFGDGSDWGITIEYLEETDPLGTAGSLGLLPQSIPNYPLLVMNGDLLTKVDFSQMLIYHSEQTADLTVCVREYDIQVPYGVVEIQSNKVSRVVEKPIQKVFVNAGIYVVNQELVGGCRDTKVLDMPEFINRQILQGKSVNAFPIHEYWLDIGLLEQYERAQTDIRRFPSD